MKINNETFLDDLIQSEKFKELSPRWQNAFKKIKEHELKFQWILEEEQTFGNKDLLKEVPDKSLEEQKTVQPLELIDIFEKEIEKAIKAKMRKNKL